MNERARGKYTFFGLASVSYRRSWDETERDVTMHSARRFLVTFSGLSRHANYAIAP